MTSPTANKRSPTLYLDTDVHFESDRPAVVSGGYGDLLLGSHPRDGKVALKRLRIGASDDPRRCLDDTLEEARVWRALVHQHVLPFLGVLFKKQEIYLVSPFVENGSLRQFIALNPEADRGTLLAEVASGLAYLHDQGVIHGDVKGENILVSAGLHALLCDFGLSTILDTSKTSTKGISGTVRWQSPELMEGGPRAFATDVYAYGITIYEILSNKLPFHEIASDSAVVIHVIVRGQRPPRESNWASTEEIKNAFWEIAKRCWDAVPESRPSISEVLQCLLDFFPRVGPKAFKGKSTIRKSGPGRVRRPAHLPSRRRRLSDDPDGLKLERFKRIEAMPRAKTASCHSQRPDNHRTCLEGTRVEVLTRIRNWACNPDPSVEMIFWLNGIAGTGKSTIAQTIAGFAESEGLLGASFFFSALGEVFLRCADRVVTTLAYQLSKFSREFKNHLADALARDPDVPRELRHRQLQKLIIEPLELLKRSEPIVIVLDALDECPSRHSKEILQLLLFATSRVTLPLRILITSRPDPSILPVFSGSKVHTNIILHDIEETIITEDIKHYLRVQLRVGYQDIEDPNYLITENDIDALARRAGKLFLYAATAARFIQDSRVSPPSAQIRTVLDVRRSVEAGAMTELDGLYTQLLSTTIESLGPSLSTNNSKGVLAAVILLRRPLPIKTLDRLLELPSGSSRAALYPFQSVMVIPPDDLQPACIYHQSFSDFITNPLRCTDARFAVQLLASEAAMACHCLRVLHLHLKENIVGIPDADRLKANYEIESLDSRVQEVLPEEMQYACINWASHVSGAAWGDVTLIKALQEFVMNQGLWWLEALSLLGCLSLGAAALLSAHTWAIRSKCPSQVVTLLRDLHRFLLAHHTSIAAGSQHLYISAIPFAPRNTELWKVYGACNDRSIRITSGASLGWSPCLSILAGHRSQVHSAIFSPDGRKVVSCSDDSNVLVGDVISGALTRKLEGHTGKVRSVAFSPDGSRIVSGSDDWTVRVWNVNFGTLIFKMEGHRGWVRLVEYSPDGTQIASCSFDHTIKIWDASRGVNLFTLEATTSWVRTAVYSPDGLRLVSGSNDGGLIFWDSISGISLHTLEGHTHAITGIAFSSNGALVASSSRDCTVRVWDTARYKEVRTLEGHTLFVNVVAFSPSGGHIASGSQDCTIRIWDVSTGLLSQKLEGHSSWVRSLRFKPDGSQIASGSDDGTVRVWHATSGELKLKLEEHTGWITRLSWTADGSRIASASTDGTVRIWDAVFSEGTSKAESHQDRIEVVEFSLDGTKVVSGSDDGLLRIWNLKGAPTLSLKGHHGWITAAAISSDGLLVASGSYDRTVRIWDTLLGTMSFTLEGHTNGVTDVVFSPCDTKVASGSFDCTVIVWDLVSGIRTWTLEGHSSWVTVVAFSQDGSQVASGSNDLTIRLWNASSGAAGPVLRGHRRGMSSLAFSKDGSQLASTSIHWQAVCIWEDARESAELSPQTSDISLDEVRSGRMRRWDIVSGTELSVDGSVPLRSPEQYTNVVESFTSEQAGGCPERQSSTASALSFQDANSQVPRLSPLFSVGQWLISGYHEKTPSRICYIPDEFHITSLAGYPPERPRQVAVGCRGGAVIILDISGLLRD